MEAAVFKGSGRSIYMENSLSARPPLSRFGLLLHMRLCCCVTLGLSKYPARGQTCFTSIRLYRLTSMNLLELDLQPSGIIFSRKARSNHDATKLLRPDFSIPQFFRLSKRSGGYLKVVIRTTLETEKVTA